VQVPGPGPCFGPHFEQVGARGVRRVQGQPGFGEPLGLALVEVVEPFPLGDRVGPRCRWPVAGTGQVTGPFTGRRRTGDERSGEQLMQPHPFHRVEGVADGIADQVVGNDEPAVGAAYEFCMGQRPHLCCDGRSRRPDGDGERLRGRRRVQVGTATPRLHRSPGNDDPGAAAPHTGACTCTGRRRHRR
jgi:hypothetical protein